MSIPEANWPGSIARRWSACCAAMLLLIPAVSHAQPADVRSAGEELRHRLQEQLVSLDFFETPLEDVLGSISAEHAIQIRIDRPSLEVAQIDPKAPVTCSLKDVPLEVALSLMLREFDLCLSPVDNVVVVQTVEEAESRPMHRVLDVTPFIERDRAKESAAELLQAIQAVVAPHSWDVNGGTGALAYVHGQLVVDNTYDVIRRVEKLLDSLQEGFARYGSDESREELGGIIVVPPRKGPLSGGVEVTSRNE